MLGTSGTAAGQSAVIKSYVGSTKVATFAKALATTCAASTWDALSDAETGKHTTESGTAENATNVYLAATASAHDDFYNSQILALVSGPGVGQRVEITDYVGSTKLARSF